MARSIDLVSNSIPLSGRVLLSIRPADRPRIGEAVEEIARSGFEILATEGTARLIDALGYPVRVVPKVGKGHPDIVECIEAGEVDLVFNTVQQEPSVVRDSFAIRRAALTRGLPYFTTLAALRAAAGAIRAMRLESIGVRALQEVHRRLN